MKNKGSKAGLVSGSALRAVTYLCKVVFKGLFFVLSFFGLWVPAVYALLGLILFAIFGFNPFVLDIDSVLYLAGFGATVVCALIITIRHLIVKPVKSLSEGYKKPIWEQRDQDEPPSNTGSNRRRNQSDSQRDYRRRKRDSDPVYQWHTPRKRLFTEQNEAPAERRVSRKKESQMWEYRRPERDVSVAAKPFEHPNIYYSAREKDTLIHEFSDRFEVYKVVEGKAILDKVEYKHNEK